MHLRLMFNALTNTNNIDPEPLGRLLGFKAVQILYQLCPSAFITVLTKKLLATVYHAGYLR